MNKEESKRSVPAFLTPPRKSRGSKKGNNLNNNRLSNRGMIHYEQSPSSATIDISNNKEIYSSLPPYVTPTRRRGSLQNSFSSHTKHCSITSPQASSLPSTHELWPSPASHGSFMEVSAVMDSPVIIPALMSYSIAQSDLYKDGTATTDSGGAGDDGYIYFPTNIHPDELEDAINYPPQYQYSVKGRVKKRRPKDSKFPGKLITVNNYKLALFRYKNEIFAISDSCSHQGAPLHLGDIEELDGRVCVSCPRHGFIFDLETGEGVSPAGCYEQQTYPLKLGEEDGLLWVGFTGIHNDLFDDTDF
jgi:nitrite reductase/ring-hydroxylating ferredoxin subunit